MSGKAAKTINDYFNPRIRAAFSMSSWFCIPEEKMLDLEILSRASAFLIKSKKPSFGRKYHVVTVSHSIAPWRWPKYYSQDWIQAVNEKHTHYTFEIRAPDGSTQNQIECIPRSYHHKTKDLAVLHIENEQTLIEKLFEPMSLTGDILLPSSVSLSLTPDDELEFQGHDLTQSAFSPTMDDDQEDIRVPMPCSVNGFITRRTKHQNFAYTDIHITDGMCGGPILTRRSLLGTDRVARIDAAYPHIKRSAAEAYLPKHLTDTRYIVGMMDGIVSQTNPDEDIRGMASFVDAADIDSFLDAIENEEIDEVIALVGGEAAKHIASDPNPDKRDLSKVFKGLLDDD